MIIPITEPIAEPIIAPVDVESWGEEEVAAGWAEEVLDPKSKSEDCQLICIRGANALRLCTVAVDTVVSVCEEPVTTFVRVMTMVLGNVPSIETRPVEAQLPIVTTVEVNNA